MLKKDWKEFNDESPLGPDGTDLRVTFENDQSVTTLKELKEKHGRFYCQLGVVGTTASSSRRLGSAHAQG